ncbi:MAG: hypothetical protein ACLQJR_05495 [Stellaceae bacterium]
MRPHGAILTLTALLLAACSEPSRPPPPYFVIPPGPPPQAQSEPSDFGLPSARLLSVNPYPEVQTFLPSHPEDVQRGPAPVPRPGGATQPFYAAPTNPGPVTGYGPGGMAQPPGAPPNPPYPAGGIGGVR